MRRVLVLGYFGYENNQLDGQTVKTRNIFSLLKCKQNEMQSHVCCFDTQSFRSSFLNVLKMFGLVLKSERIFYLGAHNSLKYLFPFIYLICTVMRKDIHYVVVGGWLVEFLKNKPLHRVMLSNIKSIHPQTKIMCQQLIEICKFNNVRQLHNFRMMGEFLSEEDEQLRSNTGVRLVFMARVNKLKGVDVIFQIAHRLRELAVDDVVIDIYGPVVAGYEEEFERDLAAASGVVSYKGVLQPDAIYKTLSQYDCMLFPTRYFTEGFPGSVLDSYLSGVPVVVSRWKYADEFVEHNFSGLICGFNDDEDFVSTVLEMSNDNQLMARLRAGAKEQATKFSPDTAWQVLKEVTSS